MRLRKLRLAGFKSFVEPATFNVPDRVVAVVGPNGCGKSNLIDAVRWVMGESAVRQLRGESMEDVIFNGSAGRQPVGQAAIELVFDNSAGRLGGPWARYSEIAVKRVVSRGGQSVYQLNGSRCRRRDITDIFLGTGLGPRSYAIIEQGLISRVIESRPEELRLFLEEAAGISRYKERRRETETRIRHTQDNLARLNDLRDELERQLRHLRRQARNAEKYRDYRAAERLCKARLLALQWQSLDYDVRHHSARISEDRTALDRVVADQRQCEARLVEVKQRRSIAGEYLEQMQQRHFQLAAQVSRTEQALEHQQQLRQRQQNEHDRVSAELTQSEAQLSSDRDELASLAQSLTTAVAAQQARIAASESAAAELARAEQELHEAQQHWEQFNQQATIPQRQAEVERARIEHFERQQRQAGQRRERLLAQQQSLVATGYDQIESLQTRVAQSAQQLQQAEAELRRVREHRTELNEQRALALEALQTAQGQLQIKQGRLTSLRTLQEAALNGGQGRIDEWLQARGWDAKTRLAEYIGVEAGWERAVETVLEDWLDSRRIERLALATESLTEQPSGPLRLLEDAVASAAAPADSLAACVTGAAALQPLLETVSIAETLAEALDRRATLAPGQSLVTREGVWLSRHWLRMRCPGDDGDSVLLREREIRSLERGLHDDRAAVASHDCRVEQLDADLNAADATGQHWQEQVNQRYRDHARAQEQLTAASRQQRIQVDQRRRLEAELQELEQQIKQVGEELSSARQRLETALAENERFDGQRQQLQQHRETVRDKLQQARRDADRTRSDQQHQALQLEQLGSRERALQQGLSRLQARCQQLRSRRQELAATLLDDPRPRLRSELDQLLGQQLTSDDSVAEARRAVAEQDARADELEQRRGDTEKTAHGLRERLERLRLGASEAGVKRQHLEEQLAELETTPQAVLAELPEQLDEASLAQELARLGERIQRLGPINLAAIEEYHQSAERKTYLDSQDADLREALSTLEAAMARIDRETRSRFKDTFDRLNDHLQALFPRLFGGGQAYLQLTGTDTLDAGVALMARPPGKRIGHIHLLSGGEKALCALALIFAIFQLNPAPFCMLDEVDAPLDDANVARFGRLVRELSNQVQFVIVTHNKLTMELAQQLVGVTMYEPGVSRLVAVDVDEAVRLAAV